MNPYFQNRNINFRKLISSRPECTEDQCGVCKAEFGDNDIYTYNCLSECAKCSLCIGDKMEEVEPCKKYCKDGFRACANNCLQGQRICLACGHKCKMAMEDKEM